MDRFKILLFVLLFSCNKQNCTDLPVSFLSYKDAILKIQKSRFSLQDNCNTSKSSWIKKASFYSCDNIAGFLLITTKTKTYIHYEVPLKIWLEFKDSDSFGKFYNRNIKGKYQLII